MYNVSRTRDFARALNLLLAGFAFVALMGGVESARAQTTTFGQYLQRVAGQDFAFTNNTPVNATFKTASPSGSPVFFLYSNISGLPAELSGIQLATVFLDSNTTANATVSGTTLTQPINAPLHTFQIIRDTPASIGGGSRTNLLTVIFTGDLTGNSGGSSAAISPSTPVNLVTMFSDFLSFNVTTQRNFSLSLSSIDPVLSITGNFLSSFSGSSSGTFASDPVPIFTPTAVDFMSCKATRIDGRVLLQWQTGYEADNLGFNIYREQDGRRVLVNKTLVAGSALLIGGETALGAGQTYVWWDILPKSGPAPTYWVEDIDLKGERTSHGPVVVEDAPAGDVSVSERQSVSFGIVGIEDGERSHTFPVEPRPEQRVSTSGPEMDKQASLASGPAVKVAVKRAGWYRVTQPALLAAGLDPKTDPRLLQLYVDGEQQRITVVGEEDGRLDPSDSVEFYGMALDTASTDARIYWLVAGATPGVRIDVKKVKGRGVRAGNSFPYAVERRDRFIYFSALKNGDEENFFGSIVSSKTLLDQAITLQHLDKTSQKSASLEVALQGVSIASHHVKISLNGAELYALNFDGQSQGVARIEVPHHMLREGDNVVSLQGLAGPRDISLVRHIRMTYQHTYTADNDALRLTASGNEAVSIAGFSSGWIKVLDVTRAEAVHELRATVSRHEDGYGVIIAATGKGKRTLLAFSSEQMQTPASVTANQPSRWRKRGHAADFVIITPRAFVDSLKPLIDLRQSQGLSVALIHVEDIYDEFSYGHKTPQAVKDLLAYAASDWKKSPRYVLLAGDASLDPRDYLRFGDADYVPTKLVETASLETASDDWFVDFNEDGVPDMNVGRLPVRTPEETARMVRKIAGYENSKPTASIALVADSNNTFNFEEASDNVRALLPAGTDVTMIYRGRMDDAMARRSLLDSINQGQKIINYAGHGSINLWRGNLFTAADAASLTNKERLTMFLSMSCLNGYFQDPGMDSLAESLMKADGGAIVAWASSGMTGPGGQTVMNQEAIRLLLNKPGITVGEAAAGAKAAMSDADVRRTWILFGDPTTRVK